MSSALVFALLISSQTAIETPATPPRLRAGTITSDDYPANARTMRAEGVTAVSLEIGIDGRVTECAIIGTSGNSELDATSCRLAQQRFGFAPATRGGQPIAATYTMRMRWSLPQAPVQ